MKPLTEHFSFPILGKTNSNHRGVEQWQLVGLITRRSQVRVLPPLPGSDKAPHFRWGALLFGVGAVYGHDCQNAKPVPQPTLYLGRRQFVRGIVRVKEAAKYRGQAYSFSRGDSFSDFRSIEQTRPDRRRRTPSKFQVPNRIAEAIHRISRFPFL